MNAQRDVLLVCRRFEVVVSYHPYEGLTPIEAHLLRAVVAGATNLETLATHLRLALRLVLDACVDLLAAGLLEIGLDGHLQVSAVVTERMGDVAHPTSGWETSFATAAAPEPRTVQLLQETVTGAVFRSPPFSPLERTGLPLLPPDPELPLVDEIPSNELLFAVLARPPRQGNEGDEGPSSSDARVRTDARIGEVRLRRGAATGGGVGVAEVGRSLLVVQLAWSSADEGAAPRFQLPGPATIPAMIRRRIATGLSNLWERNVGREKGQLFDRLDFNSSVDFEGGEPPLGDPVEDIRRFDIAVEQHIKAPSLTAHDELREIEGEVSESVARASQCTATVDLLEGARAHHDAMAKALADAEQQVILACPWMKRLGNSTVRGQIEAAVSRGVLVCLLWGMERDDVLDEETKSFLAGMKRHPSGGGVIISDRSALSHAKVIACDHRWLVVSSCNFLNSGPERATEELGIRLTSPPPIVELAPEDERTAPTHPISELLRWIKEVIPDFRLSRRIIDSPALLGMAERSRRAPIIVDILPPRLDVPISMKLWSRAWRQRATDLRKQLESARPIAVPVRDLEHREVLLYALERAQRRLFLESPDIGAAGLSGPVISAIERARKRNVEVGIRYHSRSIAGEEGDAGWRGLEQAGVKILEADTHAKLLICDDWSVIGSFNFLSFAGRGRRELGVRVFDRDIANRLATRFTSA
ncbi:MAG: phospholipase D-like domain-containing protein [Byssovorax sp.]